MVPGFCLKWIFVFFNNIKKKLILSESYLTLAVCVTDDNLQSYHSFCDSIEMYFLT